MTQTHCSAGRAPFALPASLFKGESEAYFKRKWAVWLQEQPSSHKCAQPCPRVSFPRGRSPRNPSRHPPPSPTPVASHTHSLTHTHTHSLVFPKANCLPLWTWPIAPPSGPYFTLVETRNQTAFACVWGLLCLSLDLFLFLHTCL